MTWSDVITDALLEIGVARAGDVPAPETLEFGLRTVNRLLDGWNAKRRAVYTDRFQTFVITPNLAPHTIGVVANAPTWVVTGNRPERIMGANLVIATSTPAVNIPINVRDQYWWNNQGVPTLTSSVPTDLYYEADWPNGSAYLWPVPTVAYSVELMLRLVLNRITDADLGTDFSFPPGTEDAVVLTLAEKLAPGFGQMASPDTKAAARDARAVLFDNHDTTSRIATRDVGMPRGGSHNRTSFNYHSRSFR